LERSSLPPCAVRAPRDEMIVRCAPRDRRRGPGVAASCVRSHLLPCPCPVLFLRFRLNLGSAACGFARVSARETAGGCSPWREGRDWIRKPVTVLRGPRGSRVSENSKLCHVFFCWASLRSAIGSSRQC
jgi:hypothetical protein